MRKEQYVVIYGQNGPATTAERKTEADALSGRLSACVLCRIQIRGFYEIDSHSYIGIASSVRPKNFSTALALCYIRTCMIRIEIF